MEGTLGGVIDAERVIASIAFKQTMGQPLTIEEAKYAESDYSALADEYIDLGLASGEHHADQLLRDIERQAVAQAACLLGRSP